MPERPAERAAAEAEVVRRLRRLAAPHREALAEALGTPQSPGNIPAALWRRITQETAQTLYWPLLQTHMLAHNLLWADFDKPPLEDFGPPLPAQDDLPGREGLELPPMGPRQELRARTWATVKAANLSRGMTETAQRKLQRTAEQLRSVQEARKLPARDPSTGRFVKKRSASSMFEEDLSELFADPRRITIAATEITDAISSGELSLAEAIAEANDFGLDAVWRTEDDDRVCPVCFPVDREPSAVFIPLVGYPPAHPRCRCWLNWSVAGIDRRGLAPRRDRRRAAPRRPRPAGRPRRRQVG